MARSNEKYVIWQWNCRGFRRKRGNLQQFIDTNVHEAPDVIALQETGAQAKLSGYKTYSKASDDKTPVTTLVRRNLPVLEHETGVATVDHVLVEIIPTKKGSEGSVFVLNVYSSPRKRHRFGSLFRKVLDIVKRQPLVVVGDFNAPHPAWGYGREVAKGRNLWMDAQQQGLTLVTDPAHPTRVGNSVCRDTTPDLTFVKNVPDPDWLNTQENLGSDHFIVATTVKAGPSKLKGNKIKITEWDSFRDIRRAENLGSEIDDIESWAKNIMRRKSY